MHLRLLCGSILVLSAACLPAAALERGMMAVEDDEPQQEQGSHESSPDNVLRLPGMPPIHLPPGIHIFGSDGQEFFGPMQGLQGQTPGLQPPGLGAHRQLPKPDSATPEEKAKAAKAEALKKAMAPHPSHAALRAQALDALFKRLTAASDGEEAAGITAAIEHVWMQTDSATADLLMGRAMDAQKSSHLPLALTLYDRVVELEPGWAEAWDKRATTRYLGGDLSGALADFEHTLKLEPRHFSALVAVGFILEKQGLDRRALEAFRKALALNPQQPELKAIVEKLQTAVEGRDI